MVNVIPFPDLTGFRTTAHDRNKSNQFIETQKKLRFSIQDLERFCSKLNERVEAKGVITFAFLVLLTHVLSPEDDCVAEIAVINGKNLSNLLYSLESDRKSRKDLQIRSAFHQAQCTNISAEQHQSRFDMAIVFCNEVQNETESMHSFGDIPILHRINIFNDGRIEFLTRASTRFHTYESASFYLDQMESLICSILEDDELPLFSTLRFETKFLASDNKPAKQIRLKDDLELNLERFEFQSERIAKKFPKRIALEFWNNMNATADDRMEGNYLLTYEEVDKLANIVANKIKSNINYNKSSKEGYKIVTLYLEKSHWTYIAILAVLKAGAAWCPIDTDWPSTRRKALLEKSGASIVLTAGDEVRGRLESELPNGMEIINLDELNDSKFFDEIPTQNSRGLSSDDLAYLIWTSGTTGLPKAVGIQHKAAVQALRSLQGVIPYNKGEQIKYLQFSAYNFDLMILDMFYTWGLGGTLCSSTRSNLTDLIRVANITKSTHTLLTPAVMAITPRRSIPSLQVVINGGEKLSQIVADSWSVDCCLLNLYGPAEATLIAMHRHVPMNDNVKAPNIGKALQTTSCYAIDSEDNLVIKGAIGQLALGGFQCAIGYIGDPDKTSDKFYQHPTLGRIYKTGDMVRQLHNGDFEYLGRVDDQVKIHGIRIELLEINAAIKTSDERILDSETLFISIGEDDDSDAQIVNFSVLPSPEINSDRPLIRLDDEASQLAFTSLEHAKQNLPVYMIPSLFIIVNYFPKTSSAKVDRESLKNSLRKIDILDWQNRIADQIRNSNEASQDSDHKDDLELENKIKSHISELCRMDKDKLGRHTPFPQLGIDSIRAISLSKRLNEVGIQAPVVEILTFSTLSKLSKRVNDNKINISSRDSEVKEAMKSFDDAIRPAKSSTFSDQVERILPCTSLQESLISETLQDPSRYWLHRVYKIPQFCEFGQAKEVLNEFLKSVEILRTSFMTRSRKDVQHLMPECNFIQVVSKQSKVRILERKIQDDNGDDEETVTLQSSALHDLNVLAAHSPVAFTILPKQKKMMMHIHHALYDQQSLLRMDEILASLWKRKSVDRLEPFSKAVSLIVPLNEEEANQRRKAWEKLLSKFPKKDSITPPRLTMKETKASGSLIESKSHSTSIKYSTLAKKAQDMNLSVRPLIQTALAFVLSRLCDTQHILLGDVISGRAMSSLLDSVIGPVLTTIAVPIHIQAGKSFKEIVNEVASFHVNAMPHAHFPLSQIRQILKLSRSSELFHAVFTLEMLDEEGLDKGEERLEVSGNYGIAVEHDLAIEVEVNQSGNLIINANTKKARSDPDLVTSLLYLLESYIIQLIGRENEDLATFEIDSQPKIESISQFDEPNHSVLEEYHTPYFNQIQTQSKTKSDQVAIEFYESLEVSKSPDLMTYRELMQKSNQFAQYLIKILPVNSVVAVTLPRSFDTYIALLAISQAGHVYLPIDIALPHQRKMLLMKESKARCVVHHSTTHWLKDTDELSNIAKISMDNHDWTQSFDKFNLPKVEHWHPAYILFTSGSTGIPKGCVLSHLNLSAALNSFRQVYNELAPGSLDDNVRFLARSIESFDVALLEALLTLQIGATIVTAPRHVILSDLGKSMQHLKVTHAAVVPSLFYLKGKRVKPLDLPDLRALIVGGERLTKDIVENWSSSSIPLLNAYGPTEACIGTSIAKIRNGISTGNIGKPFKSTQYVVLKKRSLKGDWSVAMRCEVGELCIGGFQVGNYLNQSNSEAFIQWRKKSFYRTGDEVLMWPDDSIEYLGRINGDSQVKVRGVRIELGEIDNVINKDSNLKDENGAQLRSITRYLSHPLHKEQIVTFTSSDVSVNLTSIDQLLHLKSNKEIELIKELHERCRKQLPTYMVPSLIIFLKALPLVAISGKYDTKLLTSWYSSQIDLRELQLTEHSEQKERQLTDTERMIKNTVVQLFKVDENMIKHSTDLFALGLDSLNFIALCSHLDQKGVKVNIGDVMSEPTLEGLAKNSRSSDEVSFIQRESRIYWPGLTKLARKVIEDEKYVDYAMPCLPLQASMISQTLIEFQEWKQALIQPIQLRYVNVARYTFNGLEGVLVDTVKGAFVHALSKHDIYRTVFFEIEEKISQIVLRDGTVPSIKINEGENWENAAIRSIAENMHQIPPIRYRISKSNSSSAICLDLVIHHALYDGVSLKALLRETETYLCSPKEEITSNKSSMAKIIQESEKVPIEDRLCYWGITLQDASRNFFPCLTGHEPKDFAKDFDQARLTLNLPLKEFRELAKKRKVTVAMILLHAFVELYIQYVGENDVIIGLLLNGRSTDNNTVHGPTVNTVPFRFTKKGNGEDTLQQIRHSYAQALKYQHIPLVDLARKIGADKGLFNVLFSFVENKTEDGEKSFFVEEKSTMNTEYPLALEVLATEESDSLDLLLQFNKGFIPAKQAQILLSQIESKFSERDIISRENLSVENADSDHQVPIIHFLEMFGKNVKRQPDAIAFAFSENVEEPLNFCTYEELDEISDQIAYGLSSIEGDIVGVFMSQCNDLYSLLIGIWKAGKAYLPLDPKWPIDRFEHVVEIAKPKVIIKSSTGSINQVFETSQILEYSDLLKIGSKKRSLQSLDHTRSIEDTAYIMFTSGSSGKPKGVQISHKALASALKSWQEILPHIVGQSRMLQLASPGFDVFLIEVCMPLALGFSFASAPKEILLNDLEETFNHLKITIADLPAALATTIDPSNIPPLEWLMSGGEQMDQRVIDSWSSSGLINAWGPTETTIGNTLGFVDKTTNKNWIGYAYPTSSLLILEEKSERILPRGCIGEIVVGGPQLGNGYFGDTNLTQKSFITISLPGQDDKQMRVYRTGDRGRMLSDGSIECFGRIEGDGQIKINSQRIELKEIEIALRKSPELKDAFVMYLSHSQIPKKQLVAFLIPTMASLNGYRSMSDKVELLQDVSLAERLSQQSKSDLSKHLPAYMVPQICFVLSTPNLPLTSNNKVDSRKMKEFYEHSDPGVLNKAEQSVQRSLTKLESKLQTLISEFVGVDHESVLLNTSLHRLGVDSISGLRLARFMRSNGFDRITAKTLLKCPSIEALARSIEESRKGSKSDPEDQQFISSSISQEVEVNGKICYKFPCTPLQSGMLLESLANEGGLYIHHLMFRLLSERLDYAQRLIHELCRQHEILRSTFHFENGKFVQIVHPDLTFKINIISLENDEPSSIKINKIRDQHRESLSTEQGLEQSSILATLIKGKINSILVVTLHHALYDGESLENLIQQLMGGTTINHSEMQKIQFRDVLPTLLPSHSATEYHKRKLLNRGDSLLNSSGSSSANLESITVDIALGIDESELLAFAKENEVSIHIVTLFSYAKMLSNLIGQKCVTFAQILTLRTGNEIEGIENVFGPCFNTILTTLDIKENETNVQTLKRLQNENDQGREYRNASLAEVQKSLVKSRGTPCNIDTLFGLRRVQKSSINDKENSNLSFIETESDMETYSTQYTLNVEFVQSDDKLSLTAVAHKQRFSEEKLREMLNDMEGIALDIIRNPHSQSTNIPGKLGTLRDLPSGLVDHTIKENNANDDSSIYQEEVANHNAVERILVETIAELVQLKSINISQEIPLTRIGLDSIASMHLAAKLRKKGIKVGVADIVQGKTVKGILKRLENLNEERNARKTTRELQDDEMNKIEIVRIARELNVPKEEFEAVLPVLPGQFFELSQKSSSIYTFMYRIKNCKRLQLGRLQDAWVTLMKKYPILRTSFLSKSKSSIEWEQIVWKKAKDQTAKVRQIDIKIPFLKAVKDNGISSLIRKAAIDFQPNTCPANLSILHDNQEDTIMLRIHHALYDALSLPVLIRDLERLYAGEKLDGDIPSFVSYVQRFNSERQMKKEESEKYWKKLMNGMNVPKIVPRNRTDKHDGSSFIFIRDCVKDINKRERDLRHMNGGLSTLIMASWATILSHICKSTKERVSVFGVQLVGRQDSFDGVERMTGNCTNVIPIVANMIDAHNCLEGTDMIWLRRLADQIKNQMNDHHHLDGITSIGDILRWTDNEMIPWNSTLNILLSQKENKLNSFGSETSFELVQDLLTQEHDLLIDETSKPKMSSPIDVLPKLQMDVQMDLISDSMHLGIRWDNSLFSSTELQKIIHDFCQLIKLGSEMNELKFKQ